MEAEVFCPAGDHEWVAAEVASRVASRPDFWIVLLQDFFHDHHLDCSWMQVVVVEVVEVVGVDRPGGVYLW